MSLKQIEKFVQTNEDLFQKISELDPPLPTMDASMDLINEKDYYGIDFTKNPVYMLFFTGSSNYFPGILPIENIPLDQCPIYIFDIASDNQPSFEGNFKKYISTLLKFYIKKTGDKKSKKLLKSLNKKFSDNVIMPTKQIDYYNIDNQIVFTIKSSNTSFIDKAKSVLIEKVSNLSKFKIAAIVIFIIFLFFIFELDKKVKSFYKSLKETAEAKLSSE
jgi:hypothetical protein